MSSTNAHFFVHVRPGVHVGLELPARPERLAVVGFIQEPDREMQTPTKSPVAPQETIHVAVKVKGELLLVVDTGTEVLLMKQGQTLRCDGDACPVDGCTETGEQV